jgi:hypothetical protein
VTILKRQFITDAAGNPIGVILPLEEYALVKEMLEQRSALPSEADKLDQMAQAVHDPLFMADLHEAMSAFAEADAEWWEPTELEDISRWEEAHIWTSMKSSGWSDSGNTNSASMPNRRGLRKISM